MRAPGLVLIISTLLAARADAESVVVSGFTFQLPPGWRNLSPGALAENFRGMPPQLVAKARAAPLLAIDGAGMNDGFVEGISVILTPCPARIDESTIDHMARGALRSGAEEIVERGVVTVGGVASGRIMYDISWGAMKARLLQFLLPSRRDCAVLTYSATRDDFARYLPSFEAATQATGGLSDPVDEKESSGERLERMVLHFAVIGCVLAGIAVVIGRMMRRDAKRG